MGCQLTEVILPWAFPLVIFCSICYMGVKVGGEPPANLPQIDIYGMEAENIKAGNICQPGGRKWCRGGWEHGGCCLSAGT